MVELQCFHWTTGGQYSIELNGKKGKGGENFTVMIWKVQSAEPVSICIQSSALTLRRYNQPHSCTCALIKNITDYFCFIPPEKGFLSEIFKTVVKIIPCFSHIHSAAAFKRHTVSSCGHQWEELQCKRKRERERESSFLSSFEDSVLKSCSILHWTHSKPQ